MAKSIEKSRIGVDWGWGADTVLGSFFRVWPG